MRPEPFDPTPGWIKKLRDWHDFVRHEEARVEREPQTFELTRFDQALLRTHHTLVQSARRSQ